MNPSSDGNDTPSPAAIPRVLTIGHSNRTSEEFLALLRDHGAEVLVDVRKLPGSRAQPQFNADALEPALEGAGIKHRRLMGLTGRRPVSHDVPFETNAWWSNRSFHNYADHALGKEFRADLDTLIGWAEEHRTVLMCAEAVWWRCHRRIIADHLIGRGRSVTHIMGHTKDGQSKDVKAILSEGAVVNAEGFVTYPQVTP